MKTQPPPPAPKAGASDSQLLFGRVLVAETLARVALATAIAGREPDEQRRLIAEIRAGLVVNIVGDGADQVRAAMHRRMAVQIGQVEELLGHHPEAAGWRFRV